jgi:hypothetical protein
MNRWLRVTESHEVGRLRRRLDADGSVPEAVPTTRGWADALLSLWVTEHPTPASSDPAVRVGAYVFSSREGEAAGALLVAAEQCLVAARTALVPVMRPAEWRNAKRALTESGLDQSVVEELVTPTTTDGAFGAVEPSAVAGYVAGLKAEVRDELLRYFSVELQSYADSCRSLAHFDEHGDLPTATEVVVPWSAVLVLRDPDGTEHARS